MPGLFHRDSSRTPLLPTNTPRAEDFRHGRWARLLAQFAFVLGIGAMMYGTLGYPNIGHVAERHWNALTPNAWIVVGLFSVHLFHQVVWLCALVKPDSSSGNRGRIDAWLDSIRGAPPFVPVYAIGQFCLATWTVSWIYEYFLLAFISALLYTLVNISYLASLTSRESRESSNAAQYIPRYAASLGLLGVLSTGAVVINLKAPTKLVKAFTGIMFGLSAFSEDFFFGPVLVWEVVALAVEHYGNWNVELWWMAFGVGVITLINFGLHRRL